MKNWSPNPLLLATNWSTISLILPKNWSLETVDSCNTVVDCFLDISEKLVAEIVHSCNKLVDCLITNTGEKMVSDVATNWLIDCFINIFAIFLQAQLARKLDKFLSRR